MGGSPQKSPNENLFLGCQVGRMGGRGRGGHEKFIREGTPEKFKKIHVRGGTRSRIRGDSPRKSSVPFSLSSWWPRGGLRQHSHIYRGGRGVARSTSILTFVMVAGNGPSQHSQFDHGGRGVAQVSPEKKYH